MAIILYMINNIINKRWVSNGNKLCNDKLMMIENNKI
jgi:hypothetical protein